VPKRGRAWNSDITVGYGVAADMLHPKPAPMV
jgi:hypothetical protein